MSPGRVTSRGITPYAASELASGMTVAFNASFLMVCSRDEKQGCLNGCCPIMGSNILATDVLDKANTVGLHNALSRLTAISLFIPTDYRQDHPDASLKGDGPANA